MDQVTRGAESPASTVPSTLSEHDPTAGSGWLPTRHSVNPLKGAPPTTPVLFRGEKFR